MSPLLPEMSPLLPDEFFQLPLDTRLQIRATRPQPAANQWFDEYYTLLRVTQDGHGCLPVAWLQSQTRGVVTMKQHQTGPGLNMYASGKRIGRLCMVYRL